MALGGLAVGGIAVGGLGLGVLGVGGLAVGLWACCGGAVAWHVAVGGAAVAHDLALGGGGVAPNFNDALARATLSQHPLKRGMDWFAAHQPWFVAGVVVLSVVPALLITTLKYRREPGHLPDQDGV